MHGNRDPIALREPMLPAAPSLHAHSDVDRLERVLVHRPGSELARITAGSAERFLFDAPVSLRRAQRHHDELTATLRAAGVHVHQLEAVLCRALDSPPVRARLVAAATGDAGAADLLIELPPERLARVLIAGLTVAELRGRSRRLHGGGPGRWLVRPLPNLMFTRDLFSVLGDGVARGEMRREARSGEGAIADAALEALGARTWWARGDAGVEGGDVLLAGDGVVVVGIGERTSRTGAARLARRLLDAGVAREVIGAVVPPGGPFHLDLAITVVDEASLLVDRSVVDATATIRWRPDRLPTGGGDLVGAIGRALGATLTVIATLPESHDRAWDRGANVVALEPGKVVAYAENRATNRRLQRAGIEVLAVPGSALGLGRGGPRCLTAPLARRPPEDPGGGRATRTGAPSAR